MTRNEKLLAITPIVLLWLGSLLSWGWATADWPEIPYVEVSPPVVFRYRPVIGAIFAIRIGVPLWSYTWLALGISGLFGLVSFGIHTGISEATGAFRLSTAVAAAYSIAFFITGLLIMLIVSYALSRRRGIRHGLTFCALSLAGSATTFALPMVPADFWGLWQYAGLAKATVFLVTIVLALYFFLDNVSESLKLFWSLLIVAFLSSYVSAILPTLQIMHGAGGTYSLDVFWGGLFVWGYVIFRLLIVWLASWHGDRTYRGSYSV